MQYLQFFSLYNLSFASILLSFGGFLSFMLIGSTSAIRFGIILGPFGLKYLKLEVMEKMRVISFGLKRASRLVSNWTIMSNNQSMYVKK